MTSVVGIQAQAYRFFDAAFLLETDTPAFLARFDRAYGRFRAAAADDAHTYRVLLGSRPEAAIDGEVVRSDDAEALSDYAYNAILNAATARVRSHYLFHAAALRTPGGDGLILAGDAGLGKTTLTLALGVQGFGFLSDDVAAVNRASDRLCPFPRRLGQRFAGARRGEKRLVDPSDVADPCPARFLLALTDPAETATDGREKPWYLALDRAGVIELIKEASRPGHLLRWRGDSFQGLEGTERVCKKDPCARDLHPHGPRGFPGLRPALAGHDRHARHLSRQHVHVRV